MSKVADTTPLALISHAVQDQRVTCAHDKRDTYKAAARWLVSGGHLGDWRESMHCVAQRVFNSGNVPSYVEVNGR